MANKLSAWWNRKKSKKEIPVESPFPGYKFLRPLKGGKQEKAGATGFYEGPNGKQVVIKQSVTHPADNIAEVVTSSVLEDVISDKNAVPYSFIRNEKDKSMYLMSEVREGFQDLDNKVRKNSSSLVYRFFALLSSNPKTTSNKKTIDQQIDSETSKKDMATVLAGSLLVVDSDCQVKNICFYKDKDTNVIRAAKFDDGWGLADVGSSKNKRVDLFEKIAWRGDRGTHIDANLPTNHYIDYPFILYSNEFVTALQTTSEKAIKELEPKPPKPSSVMKALNKVDVAYKIDGENSEKHLKAFQDFADHVKIKLPDDIINSKNAQAMKNHIEKELKKPLISRAKSMALLSVVLDLKIKMDKGEINITKLTEDLKKLREAIFSSGNAGEKISDILPDLSRAPEPFKKGTTTDFLTQLLKKAKEAYEADPTPRKRQDYKFCQNLLDNKLELSKKSDITASISSQADKVVDVAASPTVGVGAKVTTTSQASKMPEGVGPTVIDTSQASKMPVPERPPRPFPSKVAVSAPQVLASAPSVPITPASIPPKPPPRPPRPEVQKDAVEKATALINSFGMKVGRDNLNQNYIEQCIRGYNASQNIADAPKAVTSDVSAYNRLADDRTKDIIKNLSKQDIKYRQKAYQALNIASPESNVQKPIIKEPSLPDNVPAASPPPKASFKPLVKAEKPSIQSAVEARDTTPNTKVVSQDSVLNKEVLTLREKRVIELNHRINRHMDNLLTVLESVDKAILAKKNPSDTTTYSSLKEQALQILGNGGKSQTHLQMLSRMQAFVNVNQSTIKETHGNVDYGASLGKLHSAVHNISLTMHNGKAWTQEQVNLAKKTLDGMVGRHYNYSIHAWNNGTQVALAQVISEARPEIKKAFYALQDNLNKNNDKNLQQATNNFRNALLKVLNDPKENLNVRNDCQNMITRMDDALSSIQSNELTFDREKYFKGLEKSPVVAAPSPPKEMNVTQPVFLIDLSTFKGEQRKALENSIQKLNPKHYTVNIVSFGNQERLEISSEDPANTTAIVEGAKAVKGIVGNVPISLFTPLEPETGPKPSFEIYKNAKAENLNVNFVAVNGTAGMHLTTQYQAQAAKEKPGFLSSLFNKSKSSMPAIPKVVEPPSPPTVETPPPPASIKRLH